MTRFAGKNIFVTLTNITQNFNSKDGDSIIDTIFNERHAEYPCHVWESSDKSNDHVHIVYMLTETVRFSRKAFQPLLEFFGTLALNIQTFSRKQTYKHSVSNKSHRGKPDLWLFEKLYYCNLPAHESYFDTAKLSAKKPTVRRVVADITTPRYKELRAGYDAWLSESTKDTNQKPAERIFNLIYEGFSLDDIHEMYEDKNMDWKFRKYILENYDKVSGMISTHERIKSVRERQAKYSEERKKFRPFQQDLSSILDDQNDRNIHCHIDGGNTGKNTFCDIESLREDTCVIQSAKTANIAYAWNHKKHKRIIIDVPRGKMAFLNTSAIEKLKNGQIFSTKYKPEFKHSDFKPSILILGNESLDQDVWTSDRLTRSWTHKDLNFELRNGTYESEINGGKKSDCVVPTEDFFYQE